MTASSVAERQVITLSRLLRSGSHDPVAAVETLPVQISRPQRLRNRPGGRCPTPRRVCRVRLRAVRISVPIVTRPEYAVAG
jgi:hypothetical protein